MKVKSTIVALLAAGLMLVGCGAADEAPAEQPEATGAPKGTGQTFNEPSQAPDSGGYRIAPANPNDEKYKADPRLGGGGG